MVAREERLTVQSLDGVRVQRSWPAGRDAPDERVPPVEDELRSVVHLHVRERREHIGPELVGPLDTPPHRVLGARLTAHDIERGYGVRLELSHDRHAVHIGQSRLGRGDEPGERRLLAGRQPLEPGGQLTLPAVWMLSRLGVPDLLRLLRRAGLTTLDRTADYYGYGLTMGDAEVRLDELVAAYSVFARGGRFLAPRGVRAVVPAEGPRRELPRAEPHRLVSERAAFWITDILSDARARAYIFGTSGSLDFAFPVAVKTGTSQAFRDNWTVGFTRELTVGVWVGNFDRKELRNSSGVTGAAPIFHDVLTAAQKRVAGRLAADGDAPLASPPRDLSPRPVCALSGLDATPLCPRVETEWLPNGATLGCLWHRRVEDRVVVAWPAPYRTWARERGLLDEGEATLAAARYAEADGRPLRILSPPAGAVYLIDPTLRAEFQTLALRGAVLGRPGPLSWRIDGRHVGTSAPDHALDWPLERGEHTVAVSDERGRRDETTIQVR